MAWCFIGTRTSWGNISNDCIVAVFVVENQLIAVFLWWYIFIPIVVLVDSVYWNKSWWRFNGTHQIRTCPFVRSNQTTTETQHRSHSCLGSIIVFIIIHNTLIIIIQSQWSEYVESSIVGIQFDKIKWCDEWHIWHHLIQSQYDMIWCNVIRYKYNKSQDTTQHYVIMRRTWMTLLEDWNKDDSNRHQSSRSIHQQSLVHLLT